MNRLDCQRRRRPAPRGFTFVEILVTITIIGILAGMVMAGLVVARQAAREAATKATIAKLHNIIMTKWEGYSTRRLPITDVEMQAIAQARFGFNPNTTPWTRQWAARVRLAALRDLMRMEMPERWTDIWDFDSNAPRGALYLFSNPALFQAYIARVRTIVNGNNVFLPSDKDYPAKCLYLFVMTGGSEDVRRQFRETEIAVDPDDGFRMFVDGWGHPIYFLRWAPGFNDSDLQPNVTQATASDAAKLDHDPFDSGTAMGDPAAWRLVPLIYSAGRDGVYGLWVKQADEDRTTLKEPDNKTPKTYYWLTWNQVYSATWNPSYTAIYDGKYGVPVFMGQPMPVDALGNLTTTHFDNIHNHHMEMR